MYLALLIYVGVTLSILTPVLSVSRSQQTINLEATHDTTKLTDHSYRFYGPRVFWNPSFQGLRPVPETWSTESRTYAIRNLMGRWM